MNAIQRIEERIEELEKKGFDIKIHRFGNYPHEHKVEVLQKIRSNNFLSDKFNMVPVLSLSVGNKEPLPLDLIEAVINDGPIDSEVHQLKEAGKRAMGM
ncbi:MAG TPA: hypothetical protein VM577_03690 [Anaerovoracaceae bacterium]|nr:hypothetical protein [Anaerovoracaceae bacterium]